MKSNKAFQETFLSDEIIYLLFESYPKSLKEKELLKMLSIYGSERVKKELRGLGGDYRIQKYNDRYKLTPYWHWKLTEFLFA